MPDVEVKDSSRLPNVSIDTRNEQRRERRKSATVLDFDPQTVWLQLDQWREYQLSRCTDL